MGNKNHPEDRSQRQLRVAEQIRHVIIETLQRGKLFDETLQDTSFITIAEVRISPDLKNATAYVMSFQGQDLEEVSRALSRHANYFQKEIGKKLTMKFTPRLRFLPDDSFAESGKIEGLIRKINEENQE